MTIVDQCERETTGKTLTFVKATDSIVIDGSQQIRTQTKGGGKCRPDGRPSGTHNLTKSYGGRTVVRGVNLDVASAEIVGLLGPNGAGKTTTFYMTVGLTRPIRAASSWTGAT